MKLTDRDSRQIQNIFDYREYMKLDCCDWTAYSREIAKPKDKRKRSVRR